MSDLTSELAGELEEMRTGGTLKTIPLLTSPQGPVIEVEGRGEVRVVGCFQAIEFVRDRETAERDTELQDAVAAEMLRRGVLADSSTTSLNIQPSLVMPAAALDKAYALIAESIEQVLEDRQA